MGNPVDIWISPETHKPPCILVCKTSDDPPLDCYIRANTTVEGLKTYAYRSKECGPGSKISKENMDYSTRCQELGDYTATEWGSTGMRKLYLAHFPEPEPLEEKKEKNAQRRYRSSTVSEDPQSKRQKLNEELAPNRNEQPLTLMTEDQAVAEFDNFSVKLSNEAATLFANMVQKSLSKKEPLTFAQVNEMREHCKFIRVDHTEIDTSPAHAAYRKLPNVTTQKGVEEKVKENVEKKVDEKAEEEERRPLITNDDFRQEARLHNIATQKLAENIRQLIAEAER